MQLDSRPILRFPLNIDRDKLALVLSNDTENISFGGIGPKVGADVIEFLNLRPSVKELIASLKGEPAEIFEFLRILVAEKLASESEPTFYTGSQIANLLQQFFSDWNEVLFSHLLWTSLASGGASEAVLDGWLVETYHFIRGANARLSYAASQTVDLRVRDIFVHHYVEEYDHYKFFAESLRRHGIGVDAVERLRPLPSTSAVINMMRRAARIDYLAYAACSGLLESTGCDSSKARSFYGDLASHYDKSGSRFVEPMLNHVELDEGYEHGNVMADIFKPIQRIEPERANRIVECVYQFKETLLFWFDDIQAFYFRNQFDETKLHRNYR